MADRYWVREPGESDHARPLSSRELRELFESRRIRHDAEVLPFAGQSPAELQASDAWRPVAEVFAVTAPAADDRAARRGWLSRVREATVYPTTRLTVEVACGVALLATFWSGIREMVSSRAPMALPTLLFWVGIALFWLVLRGVFRVLIDAADAVHRRVRIAEGSRGG